MAVELPSPAVMHQVRPFYPTPRGDSHEQLPRLAAAYAIVGGEEELASDQFEVVRIRCARAGIDVLNQRCAVHEAVAGPEFVVEERVTVVGREIDRVRFLDDNSYKFARHAAVAAGVDVLQQIRVGERALGAPQLSAEEAVVGAEQENFWGPRSVDE